VADDAISLFLQSARAFVDDEREKKNGAVWENFSRKAAQKTKVKSKKNDGQRRRKERRQGRTHQLESEGPGARRRCFSLARFFFFFFFFFFSVFSRCVRALFRERERENEISLSFFFQNSIFFFFFSRISLSLLLLLSLTRQSLSAREKQQDNAEVHFKVKMGTKFKKVRNCLRAFRRVPFSKESARFFFFSLSLSLSGTNNPSSKKEIERVAFEMLAPILFYSQKNLIFTTLFSFSYCRSSTRSCSANLSNRARFDSCSTGKE